MQIPHITFGSLVHNEELGRASLFMAVLRNYIMVNSKGGATCNNSKKFKLVVIKFCHNIAYGASP